MTTAPLTSEELRQQVADVLANYGLSVDELLQADIDDLESDELRDLWLMVKGALTPTS
ncbi:MAG: hypothetical protein ACYC06_00300 [Ilumatobacteraceae bacterium]